MQRALRCPGEITDKHASGFPLGLIKSFESSVPERKHQ